MMKEFIIHVAYGGLGDHLFHSILPRVAKECGFDKVYISNQSPYRNNETKELVWDINPYVDGYVDEAGPVTLNFGSIKNDENIIDRVMLEYGLDNGKRFQEPEVYYKPNIISGTENINLFDPNFVTPNGHPSGHLVQKYFNDNDILVQHEMMLRDNNNPLTGSNITSLETKTIKDFSNLLYSCNSVYCFTSGTATLAAALAVPATVFYQNGINTMFHHSKLHNYIEIN